MNKMKKIENYLKDFITEPNFKQVEELIKQAQMDAIKATCKRCAEETTLLINNLSSTDKEYNDYYQCGDDEISVNRKGILKIAEKMKDELK